MLTVLFNDRTQREAFIGRSAMWQKINTGENTDTFMEDSFSDVLNLSSPYLMQHVTDHELFTQMLPGFNGNNIVFMEVDININVMIQQTHNSSYMEKFKKIS
jgi:hypothetical protein